MQAFLIAPVLLAAACSAAPAERPGTVPAASAAPLATAASAAPGAPVRTMSREQAERYVLALINKDREAAGLEPVRWDETAARAGRRHARDMRAHGFVTHTGSDGSVPEQRYTEAGGQALVMENVGCVAGSESYPNDTDATFSAEMLEKIQQQYMAEKPPNDGHRQNILGPRHVAAGVGLAQPEGLDMPCMAQELVDDYGEYVALPRTAQRGQTLQIRGTVHAPASVAAVGLSRIDLPRARRPEELRRMHGYTLPSPYELFWPAGSKTRIVLGVDTTTGAFSIDVPLNKKPGLYEVSVWATFPKSKDVVTISLRTIEVR